MVYFKDDFNLQKSQEGITTFYGEGRPIFFPGRGSSC